jgi:hypothetical protein
MASAGGGSQAMVRTTSSRSFGVSSEFEALAQELGSGLATKRAPAEVKES